MIYLLLILTALIGFSIGWFSFYWAVFIVNLTRIIKGLLKKAWMKAQNLGF